MNPGPDPVIRGAPADVAGHRVVNVAVGRVRVVGEKRRGRHDLPGLAVAALGDVELAPRLLQGMGPVGRKALDRRDGGAGGRRHRHHARPDGRARQVHGARGALADAASELRADEAEAVAKDPEKGRVGGDVHLARLPVYSEGELAH